MTEYRTTSLGQFGHPELVVDISPEYTSFLQWFFSYFENKIKNGGVFRSGQTVQIGWMVVKLFSRPDEAIEVCEPRFDQIPIKWCSGVNRTLRDLMVQSKVCRKLNVEPIFPSILDVGLLSDALIDGRPQFMMSRDIPSEKDCGWGFQELDPIDLSIGYYSLYEIAIKRPMVIPFLAIPQVCSIEFIDEGFVISYADRSVSMNDIEFLQQLGSSAYFGSGFHGKPSNEGSL